MKSNAFDDENEYQIVKSALFFHQTFIIENSEFKNENDFRILDPL